MTLRTSSLLPESVASIAVGFAAGITSTVLTGWAPLSSLGRAIIFLGSCLSGAVLAYWASRASGAPAAIGKSGLAGALQANISACLLLIIALKIDQALHISPALSPPSDLGPLALIILIVGSVVGFFVGAFYAIVPAFVAHARKTPRLANADRALAVSAAWLTVVAAIHSRIVKDWAAWAPLAVLAVVFATTALVRTAHRARFLSRVRAGLEPRYRIEPAEGRSILYRIAEEDDREWTYRDNATPPAEPEAVAHL